MSEVRPKRIFLRIRTCRTQQNVQKLNLWSYAFLIAVLLARIATHSYAVAATVANDGAATGRLSENSGCTAFVCTNGAVAF